MRLKRNTFATIITSILVLSLMSSCVVNKPDLNGITQKDYNTRRKVTGAHYTKRMSIPGIILTAAAPVAGAVAGYNINMVTVQKGAETTPVKPANAAIGAVVGYSVANFVNYCVGLNKRTTANDPVKWTKNINNNYLVVPGSIENNGSFTIIEKSADRNFTVKNLDDTKQFYAIFPSSSYRGSVFQQSINICNRSQLLELLALDKNNQYANDAKRKYITESSTYEELATANNKFPEISYDYEEHFARLVKNATNAIDFHRRYPSSKLSKAVVWKAFTSSIPSKGDINSMRSSFGDIFEMTKSDLSLNPTDNQKSNFLRAMFQASNIKNETDLELFYRKYDWLTYSEKATDIVTNVYSIAYNSFDNGDYIIYYLKQLPKDPLYTKWGVTNSVVQTTIDKQMKIEAEKVTIASTKSLGQNSTDWEKWVNNMTYTAGIVAETGNVKYIIYGEIENQSKFDLPVVISASADLVAEASMKTGGGFFGQLFSALFDVAASQTGVKEKTMSSCKSQFVIPSMPAKTKSSYAILLNFGNNGNTGVNAGDWFKIVTESKLKNLQVTRSIEKQTVSNSTLDAQESWLELAKNGLPGVILTDLKRNERVDEEVWAQRWEVEKRRRAEAAAAYEAKKAQEKHEQEVQEAIEKEIANRQYTKKFKASYETFMPAYQVTEWYVTFGDGTSGFLCYGYSDRWSYCSDALFNDPGSVGNPMSCWRGGYKTEQEAIENLYNDLH